MTTDPGDLVPDLTCGPDAMGRYRMMHEYEALLFSDCGRFGAEVGRPDLVPQLQDIRNAFRTPEEIDDSPQAAPSKRIVALADGCQKPLLGPLAAVGIDLERIRNAHTFPPGSADWKTSRRQGKRVDLASSKNDEAGPRTVTVSCCVAS